MILVRKMLVIVAALAPSDVFLPRAFVTAIRQGELVVPSARGWLPRRFLILSNGVNRSGTKSLVRRRDTSVNKRQPEGILR